jgi:hypothetical protein
LSISGLANKNLCKPNRRLINQSAGSVDEPSPVTSPEHVITIQLQRQMQHSKEVDKTLEQLQVKMSSPLICCERKQEV